MSEMYDEDYFLRGKQTGKSLYENYRWLPELTIPMARTIAEHLKLLPSYSVLDFGCARGYLVKAFRFEGYKAFGYDTSEWALANCDRGVASYVHYRMEAKYDWIIAKDVLEHVPNLMNTIAQLIESARVGIFVVVPLVDSFNSGVPRYEVPAYEEDITHLHRFSLGYWANYFMNPGWSVTAQYRIPGIKDNYAQYPRGNGFITVRRLNA